MPHRVFWALSAAFVVAIGIAVWASATTDPKRLTDSSTSVRDIPERTLPRRVASPPDRKPKRASATEDGSSFTESSAAGEESREKDQSVSDPEPISLRGMLAWPGPPPQGGALTITIRQTEATLRVRTSPLPIDRTWSISGVGAGSYALEFEWVSTSETEDGANDPRRLIGELPSVTVPSGQPVSGLRIEMQDSVRFEGTIRDQMNLPVPNAELRLRLEGAMGLRVRKVRSDSQGRYLVEGWGSGRYELTANATSALATESRDVSAELGRRYRENFLLQRGFSVGGIVLGRDGTPVADATVTLQQEETRSTRTDNQGAFRIGGVRAGPAVLFARQGPKDGDGDRGRAEIEVDGDVSTLRLTLGASLTIRGRILDGDGNPVAGVIVVATHEGRFWNRQSVTSRNDGSFRITGCYEGDYRLSPFPSRGSTPVDTTISVNESPFVELRFP